VRDLRGGHGLKPLAKARLWLRIVRWYLVVRIRIGREPLPRLATRIGDAGPVHSERLPPRQLAWAVDRTLRIGRLRPRCIFNALVLYRLLREQGDAAELVIGLPKNPADKSAHAWVELDGVDVGPPPGRSGHEQMARFA
jgi:Transglutaminase-like superfamily